LAQQGVNYQGVARDGNSELLINENITIDININKTTANGVTVYSETHAISTDANGVFSLVIGNGTPALNLFEDINWAETAHFFNVWLNGTEIGTTKFMSVPYTQAMGKWQAHNNGVTPKGTGGSIYVGDFAGETDDLSNNQNIGIGTETLRRNSTGSLNIALGKEALFFNDDGDFNIALGRQALYNNSGGHSNIAIGDNALSDNTGGFQNLAIGNYALTQNTSGDFNTAIGIGTLQGQVDNGSYNVALGHSSLFLHQDGDKNTSIGESSLYDHITGEKNTSIGADALNRNLTGSDNTAIGSRAGYFNLGSSNVFIGQNSGTNSVFNNVNNTLVIDNTTDANPLIYGEFDNEILGFDAKVGIGTKTPTVSLHVAQGNDVSLALGTGYIILGSETGTNLALDNNEIQARNAGVASDLYLQTEGGNVRVGGSIVHASDRRLKKDIEDLSYGLEEILKLQPKEYNWKNRTQDHKSLGLIAQDVESIIINVVTYDADIDRYGISYTELIPVLIKAIQEQNTIIKLQSKRNIKQSKTINDLDERLQALEASLSVSN
jgi:hypothetical protein